MGVGTGIITHFARVNHFFANFFGGGGVKMQEKSPPKKGDFPLDGAIILSGWRECVKFLSNNRKEDANRHERK